jgi:hypothetical protein
MTPKEKADELFWKYRPIIAGKQFVTGLVLMSEAKELTKQCALVAVDEIILEMDNVMLPNPFKQYWNEIKQEIEKL